MIAIFGMNFVGGGCSSTALSTLSGIVCANSNIINNSTERGPMLG